MPDEDKRRPSGREIYEAVYTGAQPRPYIPRLRSDPSFQWQPANPHSSPHSLEEFRKAEGRAERKRRLQELWKKLPKSPDDVHHLASAKTLGTDDDLTPERAAALKSIYENELLRRCGGESWTEFKKYAEEKEVGVYISSSIQLSI